MIAALRAIWAIGGLKVAAAAGLTLLVAYAAGYALGRYDERGETGNEALQARNEGLQQVIDTYRKVYGASIERAKADAAALQEARKLLEEYEDGLDPHIACTLSPDDARRLRDIR